VKDARKLIADGTFRGMIPKVEPASIVEQGVEGVVITTARPHAFARMFTIKALDIDPQVIRMTIHLMPGSSRPSTSYLHPPKTWMPNKPGHDG